MLHNLTSVIALLLVVASVCLAEPNQALLASGPPTAATHAPTRVLVVGGGPEPSYNQVAIESNVRYILRLIPPADPHGVLFASGRLGDRNVSYQDVRGNTHLRATELGHIDGPSTLASVNRALEWVRSDSSAPEMLIFTGHGSYDRVGYFRNNWYDLWDEQEFHVTDLARALASAPVGVPIAVVMTQCYSGGFQNALFADGNPDGKAIKQDFCGFFATIPSWMSAGCTTDINEKDYQDFAGYFFAALTGTDRFGKRASVADYNHDGVVGMDEAYDYTLGHDESIDTPTCTSDIFLRRFVAGDDGVLFKTPYSQVVSWASPGQRDALNALSSSLELRGENRLVDAYDQFVQVATSQADDPTPSGAKYIRFVRLCKSVMLAHRLFASNDSDLKAQYAALELSESRNPLR